MYSKTKILAINTSTESCSVALWKQGTIFSLFENCPRKQSQCILPLIQRILNQSNTELTELDALSFGRGPGSFTGVRIGMGIVQGLALGAALPIIGVSTLATMAQGAWRKIGATRVLSSIDARMGEIYWAEYVRDKHGVWRGEETEVVLKPDVMYQRLMKMSGKWATVGTGWKLCHVIKKNTELNLVDGHILLPEAKDMIPIACYLLNAGCSVSVECAEPVYLRNNLAWKKFSEYKK